MVLGRGLPERWYDSYALRLEAAFAIFFVISGFLLYRPFVKARLLDRPPVSTRAYGWRRFLRIVPAFWVALTVIALWIGPSFSSLGEVVRQYGFLQLYWGAGVERRDPAGVDAVRRGRLLRVPARCGPGSCAACPGATSRRGSAASSWRSRR